MKKLFIVANWKSNKTATQTEEWFRTISNLQLKVNKEEKEVIVCPSYLSLITAKELTVNNQLPISIGAQDISPFNAGAYTGEVYGKQLNGYAEYVIIGHSERRQYFHEDDALLEKKVTEAKSADIMPIFCVQGKDTPVPQGVSIVAYEPVFAIGSGQPDTPENANEVAKAIKQKGIPHVLYGGSVAPENVHEFTKMDSIDGVLVGGASLIAEKFFEIIRNS